MKKAFLLVVILFVSVISTACINNFAVQELNNKAKDYLKQGDYDNAISRLKSSLDLDNTIFETHYNLGIAYVQSEKYPEAVESFKNAIRLKPDFADSYYSLAVSEENYSKAIIGGTLKDASGKNTQPKPTAQGTYINRPATLSPADRDLVLQLLNDAVANYGIYLNKGKEITDKQEVQQKIQELNNLVSQYALPAGTVPPAATQPTSTTAASKQ